MINIETLFKKTIYTFLMFFCITILSTFQILSLYTIDIISICLYLLIISIFSYVIIFKIKKQKLTLPQKILCLILATITVIGKNLDLTKSFNWLNSNLIFTIISIATYFYIISKLFMWLDTLIIKFINSPTSNSDTNLKKYSFKIAFIFISIFFSIYIFSWYPGILSPDSVNEIKAFFNIPSEITENANLINPKTHWTTQHSIIHTFNLGIAVKFANFIKLPNLGFFIIYTLPQILCTIIVLAYTIKFMANNNVPPTLTLIILLLYIICPMFALYSTTTHKTIYYNLLIMIFIMLIFDYIKNYTNQKYPLKKFLLLTIISILATLYRNEGKYIIIFSLFILLFIKNINKLKILFSISLIILFGILYENIFITKMQITKQNYSAYLSLPFQQIAHYSLFHSDEFSQKDIEIIDTVLNYETLSQRYIPQFADTISAEYNIYASKQDLQNFIKVWFKHLLKHPSCYVEAFIHHTYTFYYPTTLDWYVYDDKSHIKNLNEIIELNYNEYSQTYRDSVLQLAYLEYLFLPGFRYILYNGTHFWILIIASYYILKYNKKYICTFIPLYLVFLVCLIGPSNWYRYSLPITFSIPIIIGITSYTLKKTKASN